MGDTLLNVNFTGGEPFARKDIVEIAKSYVKNTTIQSIYITTNGSLPDRIISFAKEINQYNKEIEFYREFLKKFNFWKLFFLIK